VERAAKVGVQIDDWKESVWDSTRNFPALKTECQIDFEISGNSTSRGKSPRGIELFRNCELREEEIVEIKCVMTIN
jgi:hypothetical protein